MKNSVIAIQSFFVITTIIYALLVPVVFEMDNNVFGEKNFVDDIDNDKTAYSQPQVVESECKSPCPSSEEICIEICD